jgi:hypothetical protein
LLEARPETAKDAHAILKRTWPRVDYATADLAFAYYLDASTVVDAPGSTVAITVAPIGAGRVRETDDSSRRNDGHRTRREKETTTMATGSVFGDRGLSGAIGAGLAESNRQNAERNQGNKENRGSNRDGVPISPKPEPKKTPLSLVPDHDGGAPAPEPVALSLLAGPTHEPQRRPLTNPALAGSFPNGGGQITGWAGVFVP